ncbi:MAG: adenylyltransferase/cytidyltransferase family protein, partial [Deltaproteobacteria bacterium]|nr:adenylyltransferase/cytidyltransferase family protein [Deltaproteobacteria bacterium]
MENILSREKLKERLEILKGEGKTIVFTNGCFDIIHAGHVRYLGAAKKLGDILVLALNSDSSVKTIKGDERPIVPEEERALVVGSLESV